MLKLPPLHQVIRSMTNEITRYHSSKTLLLGLVITLFSSGCSTIEITESSAETTAPQTVDNTAQNTINTEVADEKATSDVVVDTGLTESLLYELLIANLAINTKELDLAAESMARAADEAQTQSLFESATRFALHAKQFADTVRLGQQWIAQDDDNYLAYLITSVGAILNDEDKLATSLLSQLINLHSDDYARAYQRIGEVYIQHPAGLESLAVIKQIVQLQPEVAEAWMLQAAIAQRVRKIDELNTALDKVLSIDPGNERAALLKLTVVQEGPLSVLQDFGDTFSQNNPKAKSFKIGYGRALLRKELNEDALEQFLSILDSDPKDTQALYLSALVYHSMDNFDKSIEFFKRHLVERPDDDQSLVYLASALHQLKRYEEAEDVVSQIKDEADQFNTRRQIGMHIEKSNGTEAGIDYLRNVATNNDDQKVEIVSDVGHILQRANQPERAIEVLDEGLLAHPNNTTLLYQRALIYINLKELSKHERDMRVLLKLDPENAHYHNTLGYSLLIDTQDRLTEAGELINKAHALKPDDPYILDSKGWLEFKSNNLEGALLYLNRAFKIDADPEIAAHLGEVHWTLGNKDKAKSIWLEAQQKDKDNASLNSTTERLLK